MGVVLSIFKHVEHCCKDDDIFNIMLLLTFNRQHKTKNGTEIKIINDDRLSMTSKLYH